MNRLLDKYRIGAKQQTSEGRDLYEAKEPPIKQLNSSLPNRALYTWDRPQGRLTDFSSCSLFNPFYCSLAIHPASIAPESHLPVKFGGLDDIFVSSAINLHTLFWRSLLLATVFYSM